MADGAASGFGAFQDTLDAGERLARAGLLLVRPGLPEIVAVRDWVCEQIMAQLAGVPPAPWPGTDQERFAAGGGVGPELDVSEWDVSTISRSARGVVAADDSNRIIGVSESLATLTGWEVHLVGRRIVTLIPPELREPHLAGFTRHLTTGEAHVLDVPLTLPVLRSDGTRVTCSFLVQQQPTRSGRAVYLAWIEAVDSV